MSYTQANRTLALKTPLGPDKLLLVGLSSREALSQPFHLTLETIAETSTEIEFDKLLGRPVSAAVSAVEGEKRHFHGIVRRIVQGPREEGGEGRVFAHYRLEVVPFFSLLSKKVQSRVFQQMPVPEILAKVLTGLDIDFRLQGQFEPRNFCTQYRESDFHFASRLMEEEGIYYFFEHSDAAHTLVLANTPASHPVVPNESTLIYDDNVGGIREETRVHHWEKSQELTSGKYTLWDHSFELPHKHLDAEKLIQDSVQTGKVSHKLKLGANNSFEIYDYPGAYAQRFDGIDPGGGDRAADVNKIFQDNARTVGIRMQEEASHAVLIYGASNCSQLTAGHKFTLTRHFDGDGSYVLTSVDHTARDETYRSGGGETSYGNYFTCIPMALPYRPPRTLQRPRVEGCQTAVVVGPSGEEIFTDKYGRVKVQFHWDREGTNNENSSCWLRVATPWAGKQWGAIHIPRIGQEVLVDFLEGDPDRPIVVGSVYNADMMPPYKLPDNKTQSGIKSRSTLKGEPANFNEIRFEDKKGEEQLYIHAEKNQDIVVENDETHKIGFEKKDKGDQTVEVYNNQTIKVGKAGCSDGSQTITVYKDRTESVETGNEKVTIKQGNRDVVIDKGNDKHQVKMGNRAVQIDMGNDTLTIKMGNQTTKLNLGKSATEAMQSIELKVGQSSIKVDQMGVTIKGMMIKIEGQVQTEVKGLMTKVDGTAMLMAKGGITMIN
jgi:type VI secretion system secreted protein VgrG